MASTELRSATRLVLVSLLVLSLSSPIPASAGIRGPGEYSGVVFFDRWGTCILLSGPYVMYVSESVKSELRQYSGMAMLIDAIDVEQPMNPGDGLIRKYKVLGAAPESESSVEMNALELRIHEDFGSKETPIFRITVWNHGSSDVEVTSDDVGVTLMGKHKSPFSPSDGISEAVLTRACLNGDGRHSWENGNEKFHFAYKVRGPVLDRFLVKSGESEDFLIQLDISPGEYQFMVGYGGGVHEERSIMSNAISFDVNASGKASLVN